MPCAQHVFHGRRARRRKNRRNSSTKTIQHALCATLNRVGGRVQVQRLIFDGTHRCFRERPSKRRRAYCSKQRVRGYLRRRHRRHPHKGQHTWAGPVLLFQCRRRKTYRQATCQEERRHRFVHSGKNYLAYSRLRYNLCRVCSSRLSVPVAVRIYRYHTDQQKYKRTIPTCSPSRGVPTPSR